MEYLLIGGHAVGFHSRPRFTKDIDLWIAEGGDNARRVYAALIGIDELIKATRAAGREQDLVDVRELERSKKEDD